MLTANLFKAREIPFWIQSILAFVGLILVAPILAGFALIIKITSNGPVLFRQNRVGVNGIEFTLFKLRTMTFAAEGSKVTAAGDGRVTPVGKILRRSKIDELPELWNIVRGDMCFVGPRPEVSDFVDMDDPLWQEILTYRPGITDPVTLRLRNEEHLLAQAEDKEKYYRDVVQPYKLRGYAKFIREKTWKTDIRIISRTLKAVALPKTAALPSQEEITWSYAE